MQSRVWAVAGILLPVSGQTIKRGAKAVDKIPGVNKCRSEIARRVSEKLGKKGTKLRKCELEVKNKNIEVGNLNGKTSCKEIFKNGKLDYESLKNNKSSFKGKSTDEIANMLEEAGYKTEIKKSTKSKSGAEIIQIKNSGGDRNITQVQVSPGGGRHGVNPYI